MPSASTLDPRAPGAVLRELYDAPVDADMLARLAALDRSQLGEGERLTVLELVSRAQSWLAALEADVWVELAGATPRDEYDWCREEISATLHLSLLSTGNRLAHARELVERPATHAALRAGTLSPTHARALLRGLEATPDPAIRDRVEATMLDKHAESTPSRLEQATRDAVLRADVDAAEKRHENARTQRHTWLSRRENDGMAALGAYLPLDQAVLLNAALDDILAGRLPAPGDERTAAQRRVDELFTTFMTGAMYRLGGPLDDLGGDHRSSGAPAPDHRPVLFDTHTDGTPVFLGQPGQPGARRAWTGPRVRINLLMTPDSLLGLRQDPAVLVGYGTISPGLARRIAGFATEMRRLIHDPETGHLLDAAPDTYQVRDNLRDYLQLRSPTCDFVTCGMPSSVCEMDHTIPFPHGPTTRANLGPHNKRHHIFKHLDNGWTLQRDSDGTARWTDPRGRPFVVHPFDSRITQVGDEDTNQAQPVEPEAQTVIDPYPDEPCPF
jgi:hypothetical protein